MKISRRVLFGSVSATALLTAVPAVASTRQRGLTKPGDFALSDDTVLLNNGSTHPMPQVAVDAVRQYLDFKGSVGLPPGRSLADLCDPARRAFAQLINADLDEVGIVQSTSAGENLVVAGLGLPGSKGNVVTDALHHEGTLYLYRSIETRDLQIRVARPRDWRIDPGQLERLIDRHTRLVAVSLVSWFNGFEHDLRAICEIAHARGALVYADIVQAAGMIPIDVKASGVDFCGCGTYKWLMGDAGTGFLYVRRDLHGSVLKQTQWGWTQFDQLHYHVFPYDDPGDWVLSVHKKPGAEGYINVGTPSFPGLAAAAKSIEYLQGFGVERIAAHVRPLIERLQERMPMLGFTPATPLDSRSALVAFLVPDPDSVRKKLRDHRIDASLWGHRLRISPAIHNDDSDIDALLHALG